MSGTDTKSGEAAALHAYVVALVADSPHAATAAVAINAGRLLGGEAGKLVGAHVVPLSIEFLERALQASRGERRTGSVAGADTAGGCGMIWFRALVCVIIMMGMSVLVIWLDDVYRTVIPSVLFGYVWGITVRYRDLWVTTGVWR